MDCNLEIFVEIVVCCNDVRVLLKNGVFKVVGMLIEVVLKVIFY